MKENELIEAFWIAQGGKPHMAEDLWFYESSWDMLTSAKQIMDKEAENQRLREALQGILEIGKRDMSNPKYDPYFEAAKQALKP